MLRKMPSHAWGDEIVPGSHDRLVTFDSVWWAAALAGRDTRNAMSAVLTRDVHLMLTPGAPPEEITTYNLVQRLALQFSRSGRQFVALHNRSLEGGNRRTGRRGSGADLELALEVAPGTWVDLLLQAKRLNPSTGRYTGWKPTQNMSLRSWAYHHGGRTPAMLLYNAPVHPFGAAGTCVDLHGCCSSPVVTSVQRWPASPKPSAPSPTAVTVVPLAKLHDWIPPQAPSRMTDPTPQTVEDWAFPLECLYCPTRPNGGIRARSAPPEWAVGVLRWARYKDPPGSATSDTAGTEGPTHSLVAGHPDSDVLTEYLG